MLYQNWESPGLCLIPEMHFSWTYFFHNISCHIPDSFSIFHNHLANRALLKQSTFMIPKAPCDFGKQQVFHFTRLYLFLCSSACQTSLALKKSIFFLTPTG